MRGPLAGRRRPIGQAVNLVVLVVLVHCHTALAPPPHRRDRRDVITGSVHKYLSDYGYLPQSDGSGMAEFLRTEDQLRDAIRSLQAFAGIPVTGFVDPATEQLLRTPRCQLPDIITPSKSQQSRHRRYALQGQRWPSTNITWSLHTQAPGHLDRGSVRSVFHQAFSLWSKPSKLNFQEIAGDDADILVCFERQNHGDNYKFDGRGNILAHAFFPGSGRGGDVHFDADELWFLHDSPRNEGTSLLAVAAHEFGHSLGLAHSSVPEALMYPYYRGLPTGFVLPDDDRHAIQQLYGSREERQWANNPHHKRPTAPTPRQPPPRSTPPTPPAIPRTPYRPYTPYSPDRGRGDGDDGKGLSPTVRPPNRRPLEEPTNPDAPRTCDTSYDAVSLIRKDLFMFKGRYLWRVDDQGLQPHYPAEITRQWKELPRNFTKIDDVYERNDKKIVFFIGRYYYVFSADRLDRGYPRPLTDLGLPASLTHVDAVMVWGHNSKTYIFSGSQYWKLDDETGKVELDYPRGISIWKGVGSNIDSVFQNKDGVTYFFKGKGYWKFDDLRMTVAHQKPKPSSDWVGCPKKTPDQNEDDNTFDPKWGRKIGYDDSLNPDEGDKDGGTASSLTSSLLCQAVSVLLLVYFRRII